MKRIHFVKIIMLLALVTSFFPEICYAQQNPSGRRILIGFKGSKGRQDAENRRKMVHKLGGKVRYSYRLLPAVSARLSENQITTLKNSPEIAYVEDDIILHTVIQEIPWGVEKINANHVWNTNTGEGVDVAILDTGIDYDHVDLIDNIEGGVDYTEERHNDGSTDSSQWNDVDGHGTHCAGIVAALDNDFGSVGVAPGANLWAVKVLGDDGTGYLSDVIQGLEWCADNGIEIASMSFGAEEDSRSFREACDEAYEEGILLVAAAGNGGSVIYPAAYDSVVAVSATNSSDSIAGFSSTGPEVEISAPGVNIYSTYTDNRYTTWSGTSMACPHVSGVAALLYASDELGLTSPDQIREKLRETSIDLGDSGKDDIYGYGRVDASAAATASDPPVLTNIDVSPSNVILFVGERQLFTATGTDQYEEPIEIENMSWEISDNSVGTIEPNGLFEAIGAGTAIVSALSASKTGTASVTVEELPSTEQFNFSGRVQPRSESVHTISVSKVATVYAKLTWRSRQDLRLRIYDSNGEMIEEADESTRRNRVEEITTLLETGDWTIAVKSDSRRRRISYNLEVTINY